MRVFWNIYDDGYVLADNEFTTSLTQQTSNVLHLTWTNVHDLNDDHLIELAEQFIDTFILYGLLSSSVCFTHYSLIKFVFE